MKVVHDYIESKLGIPFTQVSAVFGIFLTYFLAILFKFIPNSQPNLKHLFSFFFSSAIFYFLFGFSTCVDLLISPCLVYLLSLKFRTKNFFPILIFAISMGHVSYRHFHSQFLSPSTLAFDGTAPLMVLIIKLSSFGWCLHDGTKPDKELSAEQRALKIAKMPTLLEYLGYLYFFGGFLVGPAIEYKDYYNFVHGLKPFDRIPSRIPSTLKCLSMGLGFIVIYLKFEPIFNLNYCSEPWFDTLNIFFKSAFVIFSMFIARTKFYIAWKLSEGACNLSGIGYNGIDENGTPVWNRGQNIKIRGFEFPTNAKMITDSWNINTSKWLKNYVYLRLCDPRSGVSTSFSTFITNLTSAFWHGFYPGYYMFFGTAAFFILVSRTCRRVLRPFFITTKLKKYKTIYDVTGIICTALSVSYMMVPFVLKSFSSSVQLWTKLWFIGHNPLRDLLNKLSKNDEHVTLNNEEEVNFKGSAREETSKLVKRTKIYS
ncbi:lysophospholipid acyltransferase [Clydaea vesicula]|uniref:Lysophospholipid acyltransferase n=1 Tax=Clydaea vesicula TaxID=447962 RepID=A0AAD5Y1T6_9FUNG|nr:lysophospholipid acyltransferase [Clydaea vesicula]KAJ3385324.1 lysophospholipid acyltransferase [Lobulomyces angularis]